jgi:hypothetical protein
MAQYHFAAALVCRSKGQSAVAAAAYRAGERIDDERLGKTFDYTRRRGVLHNEILAPENAPGWMRDREQLWNAVEKAEKRKDSQLARSLDIALPHELTFDQNLQLVRDFVQAEFVDRGMIADIAIHAPSRNGDARNVHAHILLTTREIAGPGFGSKARDWNSKQELQEWRESWADHANGILEREGFEERIDHRSLVDQGIDRAPTTHVGPNGKQMEERGETSDRAQQNRDINAANDNMALLKTELAESEKRLAEFKRQLAAERSEQIQNTVRAAKDFWEKPEGSWPPAPEPEPPAPPPPLQPKDAPYYPAGTAPPASGGGKAAPVPDDLSKQQDLASQQEADRQKHAQDEEKAHQDKAAKDEADRLQQLRDAETKRVEDSAKQNADRLAAQAEQMRQDHARIQADQARRAQLDAYNAEMAKRAEEARRKEEAERQAKLEDKAKEGPIREASSRYAQALGQNYDIRDPYASLAKSAMAEYAAFRRDREAYDQQIAKSADPQERQRLDLRKRIEGADYLALTGDRIAAQSEIITGRLNSQEAVKERQKATDHRIQAQDLRQQLRELHQDRTSEKEREPERSQPRPEPTRPSRSRSRGANKLDDLIKQQDEKTKAKEQEKEKDPERQKELDRERELRRKRDRDR